MLRWIALILIILVILLQGRLWWGQGGMREVHSLRNQVTRQATQNVRLQQRNRLLEAEVRDLKRGHQAIEGRARSELGLIKPGETFYQVVEPAKPHNKDGRDH